LCKVILIDRDEQFINAMLSLGFKIVVLVVEGRYKLSASKLKGVYEVISVQDLHQVGGSVEHIDFDIVSRFKHIQRDVEFALRRFIDDGMLATSIYMVALSYWLAIFEKYEIDFVLCNGPDHGQTYDTIPLQLAKHYAIPAYVLARQYTNSRTLVNLSNKARLLNVNNERVDYGLSIGKGREKAEGKDKKAGWLRSNYILRTLGKLIVKGEFYRITHPGIEHHLFNELCSYIKCLHRRYTYFRLAERISDLKSFNYIYYSMHFEPEAGTLVRVGMQNQLTLIQMIAQCLPPGWLLLIKEHPYQSKINKLDTGYYLNGSTWFKSARFYKFLKGIKNVRLLSMEHSASEVIAFAKGVATINGSAIVEALNCEKPVIMFDHINLPFQEVKGVHCVKSFAQCHEAIESIRRGDKPQGEDLSKFDNYFFQEDSPQFNKNVINAIRKDIGK
jgi:hypothetical protein